MSPNSTVTASYSTTSTPPVATASASGPLLFEAPIIVPNEETSSLSAQSAKENYLAALAKALTSLQDSINTGLTERLVQQGVLSESTEKDPDVNTRVRTKVPGQPNNSKKAQTKKQQQQQQRKQNQKNQETNAGTVESTGEEEGTTSATPALENVSLTWVTDTSMDETPSSLSEVQAIHDTDMENQAYRPKGGIYDDDDDDEDKEDKDEVDLVMEADPGEIDGACLELPKEQDTHNRKRNEQPTDPTLDSTTTKKSKGSDYD